MIKRGEIMYLGDGQNDSSIVEGYEAGFFEKLWNTIFLLRYVYLYGVLYAIFVLFGALIGTYLGGHPITQNEITTAIVLILGFIIIFPWTLILGYFIIKNYLD